MSARQRDLFGGETLSDRRTRNRAAVRRYDETHREERRESSRRWHRLNTGYESDGHLRRKYGITLPEKEAMFARQGGLCAVCGKGMGSVDKADTDHDHVTGTVRELLCRTCNMGLGYFRDRPDLLLAAVAYLQRHTAKKGDG